MLSNLLSNLPEKDAAILSEAIALLHPEAVQHIRPLSKSRLQMYLLVRDGCRTAEDIKEKTGLNTTNILTQLRYLIDEEYIQKEVYDGKPSTYRVSNLKDVVGN